MPNRQSLLAHARVEVMQRDTLYVCIPLLWCLFEGCVHDPSRSNSVFLCLSLPFSPFLSLSLRFCCRCVEIIAKEGRSLKELYLVSCKITDHGTVRPCSSLVSLP